MRLAPGIDIKWVIGFVRKPWTVRKAFVFALVIGTLAPILNNYLVGWLFWRTVPFVFFPLLGICTIVLYGRTDRGQFRSDWHAMLVTVAAGLAWAGGAAGSGWCYSAHVCMGGHMCVEHGPYPLWHYAADGGWALAVALSAVSMLLVRASISLAFGVLASFLISYRFLFGSLGGIYEWLLL